MTVDLYLLPPLSLMVYFAAPMLRYLAGDLKAPHVNLQFEEGHYCFANHLQRRKSDSGLYLDQTDMSFLL